MIQNSQDYTETCLEKTNKQKQNKATTAKSSKHLATSPTPEGEAFYTNWFKFSQVH